MAKRLFLMLFSAILGITFVPETLAQADTFSVLAVDFRAVETVETIETVEAVEAVETAKTVKTPTQNIVPATVSTPVSTTVSTPVPVNYTITRVVNSRDEYAALASNLSYGDIYRYQKLVYAHNTSALLGSLSARYVGETITLTEAGATKAYLVADIRLYERTADGYLDHKRGLMGKITQTALGHSVAIMTCAGTPDGKGGASHRLVVYLDAQ